MFRPQVLRRGDVSRHWMVPLCPVGSAKDCKLGCGQPGTFGTTVSDSPSAIVASQLTHRLVHKTFSLSWFKLAEMEGMLPWLLRQIKRLLLHLRL